MKLVNIVVKSRFTPDMPTANTFITNGLLFLNGLNCYDSSQQIYRGDFIQLIVNLKYYILYRWVTNWVNKRRLKLRNKSRAKSLTYLHSDEKQKSYLLPDWVLFSKNTIEDVAKYLEVDYLTLSIFVLYEPFL
jgi:hypothetical protein